MSSRSLSRVWPGPSRCHGALPASLRPGRNMLGKWGSHLLVSGLKGRWQCSGDFLGVRMQLFSSGSFWWAEGAVGCRVEGPLCGAAEAGGVTQRVYGRSLCWAAVPASLPLLLEGGRGWACSCLGRAAPLGTQLLPRVTDTAWLLIHHDIHWALGQPLRSEKIVASPSPRGTQPSGRCSGAGPGWGQPLDGCGGLRLGVNCI